MTHFLLRPEPLLYPKAQPVDRVVSPRLAAERLRSGGTLIVTDLYHTGDQILSQLEGLMPAPPPSAPFSQRQAHRRAYREAALRLLAPIEDHRVALQEGGRIGFLQELYPELERFALPFVQVQELFGAWNRYEEGMHLAVLGYRLHPYFGTYAPTRVTHLELFGTWLSQYDGPRTTAIDVGTGCGVLALMLCRAGFERVLATDINPNAVESVTRELQRLNPPPPITVQCTDLLGEGPRITELIVFNPPWTPGEQEGLLDLALYFDDQLFERFFEQAFMRLSPSGRIVLVFSNVMTLLKPDAPHPIVTELARGRFRLVKKLHRKVKPSPTETGDRRRTREQVEIWELARA